MDCPAHATTTAKKTVADSARPSRDNTRPQNPISLFDRVKAACPGYFSSRSWTTSAHHALPPHQQPPDNSEHDEYDPPATPNAHRKAFEYELRGLADSLARLAGRLEDEVHQQLSRFLQLLDHPTKDFPKTDPEDAAAILRWRFTTWAHTLQSARSDIATLQHILRGATQRHQRTTSPAVWGPVDRVAVSKSKTLQYGLKAVLDDLTALKYSVAEQFAVLQTGMEELESLEDALAKVGTTMKQCQSPLSEAVVSLRKRAGEAASAGDALTGADRLR
jgi:hypothetical protein